MTYHARRTDLERDARDCLRVLELAAIDRRPRPLDLDPIDPYIQPEGDTTS